MTALLDLPPVDTIDELPFTPAEYGTRLAACRREMREREIDCLVLNSPENIYYLSGFITRGYYVFQALVVTHTSDPVLVVRRYEQVNVERLSYYRNAAVWQDTDVPVEVLAKTLKDLGVGRQTIGVDAHSWFLPMSAYERLCALLDEAHFVNGSTVLSQMRAVKSAQELAYVRSAVEMRNAGFRAAREAARPGRTENDVAAAFQHAIISAGSSFEPGSAYVTSGPRTSLPHATWAGRRIETGDPGAGRRVGQLQALGRGTRADLVDGKAERLGPPVRRHLDRGAGGGNRCDQAWGHQRRGRCGLSQGRDSRGPLGGLRAPHGIFGRRWHLPGLGRGLGHGPQGRGPAHPEGRHGLSHRPCSFFAAAGQRGFQCHGARNGHGR
jgi:hypothetical protein